MESKILTQTGLDKLKKELADLKDNQRPAIIERIKIAKDHGDLSENAEYHEAKEEQSFIEGRILELEHIIKTCVIAKDGRGSDTVVVGSKVVVDKDGAKLNFTVVGSTEADPVRGKISLESPIGTALLGRKVGDEIEVQLPSASVRYKVIKIE